MRETGAFFGGELSGHIFFKENHGFDDGLYAAGVFLNSLKEIKVKGLNFSDLVNEIPIYPALEEMRIKVVGDNPHDTKARIPKRGGRAFPG